MNKNELKRPRFLTLETEGNSLFLVSQIYPLSKVAKRLGLLELCYSRFLRMTIHLLTFRDIY